MTNQTREAVLQLCDAVDGGRERAPWFLALSETARELVNNEPRPAKTPWATVTNQTVAEPRADTNTRFGGC